MYLEREHEALPRPLLPLRGQGPECHLEKQEVVGIVTAQAALTEWLRS